MAIPARAAYADPPYIGCAGYYVENEEVDHAALVARLCTYDMWALSCHTPSLGYLLSLCPEGTRVCAWVKTWCSWKPNTHPVHAWEPLLLWTPRRRARSEPSVRDWLACPVSLEKGLKGAKPRAFCLWLFDLLGLEPDDAFDDLYPGTGIVTATWQVWQHARRAWQTAAAADGIAEQQAQPWEHLAAITID